jgi:hypothetical protein
MPGKLQSRALLNLTAVIAWIWAAVRASVQAITIDEAASYTNFVRPWDPNASFWQARDNNHVLNSILMRLFTSIFGPSPLMVRAGALIGVAIYIYAARRIADLIARETSLRWPLFVCLVFNPFVFDFLVAARGYGLAMAFLLSAIVIVAGALRPGENRPLVTACLLSSLCGGLCVAANFSFTFAAAATLVALYVWVGIRTKPNARAALRLLAACVLPGAIALTVVAGSTLVHWRALVFSHGAQTFRETLQSVADASLYEPNRYIVNPVLYPLVVRVLDWIFPVLGFALAVRLAGLLISARSHDPHARWLWALGTTTASALVLSLALHVLMHAIFHMRHPLDRTAVFIVPLATVVAGVIAAMPVTSSSGNLLRRGVVVLFCVLAGSYLVCLRLTYFREWKWGSDIDKVYGVLAYYNHTCGLKQVTANWRYDAALNYYIESSRRETLAEIPSTRVYPPGSSAYVLFGSEDQAFISSNHLKVVYEGESGAVVALNPEAAPGEHACDLVLPTAGIR